METSCGSTSDLTTSEHLRQTLFYPCLDRMTQELENRFSSVVADLMKGIQACHPASETFLNEESLVMLATHYKIQLLSEEVLVAKKFMARKQNTIPDIISVFKLLNADMFPTLKAVFQVALTIPVSSCSCERSFSALRRLHTWLRNTMGQNRLNYLTVMAIEKEFLVGIDHDKVID